MDSILSYEKDANEDFYAILGCGEHSSVEQILTEYKVRVLDCHPDKHPDDATAKERFTLLLRAKVVLTTEREHYDQWRNSGVAITYKQWSAHQKTIGTSMHWAYKKGEPMIQSTEPQKPKEHKPVIAHQKWRSDDVSDALRKFRNYEI